MRNGFLVYVARRNSKGKKIYYAKFFDSNGNLTHKVSTYCSNKVAAKAAAQEMFDNSALPPSENPDFLTFLLDYWHPDSVYIARSERKGKKLSLKYIVDNQALIRNHLLVRLGKRKIRDIRPIHLEQALTEMCQVGISTRVINRCLVAVRAAYSEHSRLHNTSDLLQSVRRYRENDASRDILSLTEATRVLDPNKWKDKRMWIASLLASVTAMRQGEIRALRPIDIQTDALGNSTITIMHSYADRVGQKGTKTESSRKIPVLKEVVDALNSIAPPTPSGFFFRSQIVDKPLVGNCFLESLKSVMADCGIDYTNRKICFHSWRHFAAANALDHLTLRQAMGLTGHLDTKVFESYAKHITEADMSAIRKAQLKIRIASNPQIEK